MKKKTFSNKLYSPIPHLKFDQTEMLLLLFVVISLLVFVSWQQGALPPMFESMVLGATTSR